MPESEMHKFQILLFKFLCGLLKAPDKPCNVEGSGHN